jgi:hypothetical protein
MANAQKITRDNYTTLLKRSTNARDALPDGNVFFDTANDKIQLITAAELATIDFGSGAEANPLTHTHKIQALALYFFILQEVEADATLQNFRASMDAVGSRMGKLVGATAFLNAITLDTNASTTNNTDRDKICDSGWGEYDVAGTLQTVYHGVKSLTDINDTSQPFYQLAASLSEADRQAAAPVDFDLTGDINSVIQTYQNGGTDNRNAVMIIGVRDYGYTIGETSSQAAGVAELGPYSQGYGIGNSPVPEIQALAEADVFGGVAIAPYSNLSFYRHVTAQTRTGFSAQGAGASGNFTDEIQLSSGTVSIIQLRAWLDKVMQQDTDQNANTVVTGSFLPKRAKPLYTIDPASAKMVTRAGIYIDPAKLTADAQQNIIMTDDVGGQHFIPFNAGIEITVSDAWLADTGNWFRMLYKDAAGLNDYDTPNAITVKDDSGVDIAGNDLDARITGNTLTLTYAYDTETAGGNVTAGQDHIVVFQLGGIDASKRRSIEFTITRSALIQVDASTDAETN